MSEYIHFLITLLNVDELVKCALRVRRDNLKGDCAEYPMEPENRAQLYSLLPLHVQRIGPIVAIEEIFCISWIDSEIKNE